MGCSHLSVSINDIGEPLPCNLVFFETAPKRRLTQMGIDTNRYFSDDIGKFFRGSFTDIFETHQPMIKTRPQPTESRLLVGWGRFFSGYLLVGKLVGEPAPTGFLDSFSKNFT
jgi:hypothetical protein